MFARVPAAWPNLRATEFSRGSCCVDFLAIEPPIARHGVRIISNKERIPALGRDCQLLLKGSTVICTELPLAKLVAAGG